MKDGGWGRIVNSGSGSVFQGTAGQSYYAAAKAGWAGPYPITGVDGVAFSPDGKLLGIAGPRCPLLRCDPGTLRQGRSAAVQFAGTWEDVAARSVRTLSRRHAE